jgi:hypothetical protein
VVGVTEDHHQILGCQLITHLTERLCRLDHIFGFITFEHFCQPAHIFIFDHALNVNIPRKVGNRSGNRSVGLPIIFSRKRNFERRDGMPRPNCLERPRRLLANPRIRVTKRCRQPVYISTILHLPNIHTTRLPKL